MIDGGFLSAAEQLRKLELLRRRRALARWSAGGSSDETPAVVNVPWPLAGRRIGINVERNYNIAAGGVPAGVVANMGRHAKFVRVFVFDLSEIGHGPRLAPVWPVDPTVNSNFNNLIATIDHYLAGGLVVEYCLIPGYVAGGTYNQDPMDMNAAARNAYLAAVAAWLAARYPAARLILSPWNESAYGPSAGFTTMIADAVAAMRTATEAHWISISGPNFGHIWNVKDVALPVGVPRLAVEMHDYEATRTGDAGWWGRPNEVRTQMRRFRAAMGYTVPVWWGEIDMAATGSTGYAVDDPRRVTELVAMLDDVDARLAQPDTEPELLADTGGVAASPWAWTLGTGRSWNTPLATAASDWIAKLDGAFLGYTAPVNTAAPTITGTAQEGQTLACSTGTWSGTVPITFTYQWQRGTTNIAGATSSSYTPVLADVGSTLRCIVTATNVMGGVPIATANTAVVVAAGSGGPYDYTTSVAWTAEGTLAVIADAPPANDIPYNAGLVDWRGDDPALTTTAGGAAATMTSGQGITGTAFSNGTAANQGVHSLTTKAILFSAASASDVDGDFYACAPVRTRYQALGSALGVVYLLIRSVGGTPAWDTTLMRVGRNSGSFTRQWGHGYGLQWLGPSSGTLRIYREGATSGTYLQADLNGWLADEDIALAWVINDSRAAGVVNGAPDQISRLYGKTKAGGSHATMGSAVTAATTTITGDGTVLADIGRSRWQNFTQVAGGANNIRLYAVGFDGNPPITDTDIENNLDKLLARV